MVLRLLIDTSTLLDLAKRRDGQRLICALRTLIDEHELELLVPDVIVDEFKRNRSQVEVSMTSRCPNDSG